MEGRVYSENKEGNERMGNWGKREREREKERKREREREMNKAKKPSVGTNQSEWPIRERAPHLSLGYNPASSHEPREHGRPSSPDPSTAIPETVHCWSFCKKNSKTRLARIYSSEQRRIFCFNKDKATPRICTHPLSCLTLSLFIEDTLRIHIRSRLLQVLKTHKPKIDADMRLTLIDFCQPATKHSRSSWLQDPGKHGSNSSPHMVTRVLQPPDSIVNTNVVQHFM